MNTVTTLFNKVFKDKTDLCEYLDTEKGQLEYYVWLAFGVRDLKDFDADHLCHIMACWDKYKHKTTLTTSQIEDIEQLFIYRIIKRGMYYDGTEI